MVVGGVICRITGWNEKKNHERKASDCRLFISHVTIQYTLKLIMLTKCVIQGSALIRKFRATILNLSLASYYKRFILPT